MNEKHNYAKWNRGGNTSVGGMTFGKRENRVREGGGRVNLKTPDSHHNRHQNPNSGSPEPQPIALSD